MTRPDARSWAEQLCRRWAVRHRSREHAITAAATNGPQAVRRRLVSAQFNVCRSRDAAAVDRLAAALLCLYLSGVDSALDGLTLTAGVSAVVGLCVAVTLVSAVMLLVTGCVVIALRLVWSALTALIYSLLHFTLLLASMLAVTLATLTLLTSLHHCSVRS